MLSPRRVQDILLESLFVKGLIAGFCLAAPVGPIAILCIQRTMSHGRPAGLVSGFGAAVADALYGAAAALGVTFVSTFLTQHELILQRVGGLILCILGARLLLSRVPRREEADDRGLAGDFFSTLALTLTNPMTFVAFAAIFATIHVGAVRGYSVLTVELVSGVLIGSALWWTLVVLAVHAVRRRFTYRALLWINRSAGVFVIGVGILYLAILQPDSADRRRLAIPRRRAPAPSLTPTPPTASAAPAG